MPVRKIPIGTRTVTGYFPSVKNSRLVGYESPVELDYFYILEFDDEVESYDEQPLQVEDPQNKGKQPYTPDCLVTYRSGTNKKPLLVEIKSSEDMENENTMKKMERKFKILEEYSKINGLNFKVFTDKDIRGQYLDNIKFLYNYKFVPQDYDLYGRKIVEHLNKKGLLTISQLLEYLARNQYDRAIAVKSIWHMVYLKLICTDLKKPLTNNSILEICDGEDFA